MHRHFKTSLRVWHLVVCRNVTLQFWHVVWYLCVQTRRRWLSALLYGQTAWVIQSWSRIKSEPFWSFWSSLVAIPQNCESKSLVLIPCTSLHLFHHYIINICSWVMSVFIQSVQITWTTVMKCPDSSPAVSLLTAFILLWILIGSHES